MSRKRRGKPTPGQTLHRLLQDMDPEEVAALRAQVRQEFREQKRASGTPMPTANRRDQRRSSGSNRAEWRTVAKGQYVAGPVETRQATPEELAAVRRRRPP